MEIICKKLECELCDAKFKRVKQRTDHEIDKHRPFVCNNCLRTLNGKTQLKSHKNVCGGGVMLN